ncbi:HRDC domain-containing protein [Nocardioides marmorisolisilvae]|uniref:Ribonuclease D n=1 Tax=Nocardioides marmorisolisilvae TaxID=1542737 RepID=A0A3N0DU29_9ACTN|nr:HRDC domain-containing protein [Nocardioides marmorisolisilvae]RNL79122.1 ribonuclease D [Nocardioides marmorisolisilvae]
MVQEPADPEVVEEAPPAPLLTLRDGLPPIVDTREALDAVVAAVAAGTGPVGLDAERASGYRYSARAYLIQLRREGAGSALIDPIAFDDLADLNEAIGDAEWILHAASQDIPCLREVGLVPTALFDTELAARLLGYPRVGLATLVEVIVGKSMRKEHSAADWSKRPLPEPWLEYAALDVEVLLELREVLVAELEESGKTEWARQEFEHLIAHEPPPRQDPWRRTSGIHKAKGRRALGAVRELWTVRDQLAADLDTTPGRLIPDSAVIAAANALPTSGKLLMDTPGFHGRGARRYLDSWVDALKRARALPENELPPVANRSDGPPQVRSWADRDPVAAARLNTARAAVTELAESRNIPVENLLTPDYMRRVLWSPPKVADADLDAAVAAELADLSARQWQIDLMTPLICEAIRNPGTPEPAAAPAEPEPDED